MYNSFPFIPLQLLRCTRAFTLARSSVDSVNPQTFDFSFKPALYSMRILSFPPLHLDKLFALLSASLLYRKGVAALRPLLAGDQL